MENDLRRTYRIIVWGPGQMGQAAIRQLLIRDEFEIVAVLGFSPEKIGMDIGELLGMDPVGVNITDDKEAVLAIEADCVVYCGIFTPTVELAQAQDEEIAYILASGKNVVTPVAFTYPHAHGDDYVQKLEDACRKGKSSLHGSGENPGFWFERVAVTLTAVCNSVEHIRLDEYADCGGMGIETLQALGFGGDSEMAAMAAGAMGELWQHYHFFETLNFVSKSIYGRHLDKIVHEPFFHMAQNNIVLEKSNGDPLDFVIKAGSVQAISHRVHGYLDGEIKLTDSVNWFLSERSSPFEGKEDATWDIEIEGNPTSLKTSMQAMASG